MESPFQGILHTNVVPTEEQSRRIHALVSSSQKQADELTGEITRLESLLDELTEKRDKLTEYVDAHLALVSPARRTPDDIVREIFVAALPSDFPATLGGTAAPLLLCHVSQKWRALAISTPRLWASLHIIPPPANLLPGFESKLDQLAEAVRTWLSRSGSLPLTISFVARMSLMWGMPSQSGPSTTFLQANISAHQTILDALLEFSSRWESFRFRTPDYVDLGSLVDSLPTQLPMLRSAAIDSAATEDKFAFLKTDILTALSFRLSAVMPINSMSWSSIRHLSLYQDRYSLGESAPRHVLAILRQSPQLETCTLIVQSGEMEQDNGEPILLNNLRYLEIEDLTGDTSQAFRSLITPNLRLLRYTDESGPPKHTLPILPIISTSDCLTSLVLDVCSAITQALREVLMTTESLEELTLQWEPSFSTEPGDQVDHILVLLTPSESNSSVLCPRLQRLTLLNFAALSDDALLQFILTRTLDPVVTTPMVCQPLQNVKAYFRRTQQLDLFVLPSIQQRLTAGLKLRLEYQPPPFVSYKVWEGNEGYARWDPACKVWGMALAEEETWTRQ